MKQCIIYLAAWWLLSYCNSAPDSLSKELYPNKYKYVNVDKSTMNTLLQYYVPVYSSIYAQSGEKQFLMTATLSIRNIWVTDTIYISKVYYFSSSGKLLKKYVDSTMVLPPMASLEFIVPTNEKEGGAGANFIVECIGRDLKNEPLIQTVMTTGDLRAGFTADAVRVNN